MCLWGSDSTHVAGSTITAGLPNITGSYYGDMVSRDIGVTATGAFAFGAGNGYFSTFENYNLRNGFTFDASRSSSIYGKSSTVQPPAFVVNIWKRTK